MPHVPAVRFLAVDLLTQRIREALALESYTLTEYLDGTSELEAAFPASERFDPTGNVDRLTALDPGRTELVLEVGGLPYATSLLWTRRRALGGDVYDLGGNDLLSYFDHRRIRKTLTFTTTDQLAIAEALIDYAQAVEPGGSIGLNVETAVSGVDRDRTYHGFQRKPVAEAFRDLTAVEGGFDYSILLAWSTVETGVLERTIRFHYPRRGRKTNTHLEVGANVLDVGHGVDATKLANLIDGIGEGEGDSMLIRTAQTTTGVGTTWPLLEDTELRKDVSRGSTLEGHARGKLDAVKRPVEGLELELDLNAPDTGLGKWVLGDDVLVSAPEEGIEREWYRLLASTVDYQDGRLTAVVTAAPSEVT